MEYYDDYFNEASLSDVLIAFLFSANSPYLYRRALKERVMEKRKISNQAFSQQLYRLKKRGIIKSFKDNEQICLLEKGKQICIKKKYFGKISQKPKKDWNLIIIFDIPESKRKIREWLRNQLKDWNFEMIQKSVWKGGGPLPPEFKERLSFLGIKENVEIFKFNKNF